MSVSMRQYLYLLKHAVQANSGQVDEYITGTQSLKKQMLQLCASTLQIILQS